MGRQRLIKGVINERESKIQKEEQELAMHCTFSPQLINNSNNNNNNNTNKRDFNQSKILKGNKYNYNNRNNNDESMISNATYHNSRASVNSTKIDSLNNSTL